MTIIICNHLNIVTIICSVFFFHIYKWVTPPPPQLLHTSSHHIWTPGHLHLCREYFQELQGIWVTLSGKSSNYRQVHCWEFFRGHNSTPVETNTGVPLGFLPCFLSPTSWPAWAFLHQTCVTPAFLDRRTRMERYLGIFRVLRLLLVCTFLGCKPLHMPP